ncbi:DoxX family protein [Sphingomonas sp. RHCKR7]|uniref:DoxX family protein n=1 Tax=Sphingomonas folli TaxID=2862497 RepID=UPI001C67625A|nr:DoxX family protein [Sphingomonas folli]MBW6527239.1 DoxX family protein [Sphingomonas folli]
MTAPSSLPRRAGVALSGLVAAVLLLDGAVTLFAPAVVAPEMTATGWPAAMAPVIGASALLGALLYAVPRSAVIGAILLTGFLGGAIATHLRLGELGSPPQLVCVALGAAAWAGLWLRRRGAARPLDRA